MNIKQYKKSSINTWNNKKITNKHVNQSKSKLRRIWFKFLVVNHVNLLVFCYFLLYTVRNKKKSLPLCNFFCFDHIFVIPWVWVENLILFESWDFELFHGVQNFFGILKIFWVFIFGPIIILFFHKSKNITSPTQIKKIFHLWKHPLP